MKPPLQHTAATTPALRGPARSSQPPQIAAALPRKTKNKVNIHPSMLIFQSQAVVNSVSTNDISAGHATESLMPIARESGNQKTLKPYAMPMQRCIASAAGGTSHRLYPSRAIVRSLARNPAAGAPVSGPGCALVTLSIHGLLRMSPYRCQKAD